MSNEAHFETYPRSRPDPTAENPDNREPTGDYGWRLRAANNQIIAAAGEGFTRREDANRAIHDLLAAIDSQSPHPPIDDVDQ